MLKKEKYIWQIPVRLYHWINVVLIITLLVTGFYIGKPFASQNGEPYNHFIMGKMRLIHGLAAWFFIANFIFRLYWGFVGNEYAKLLPQRKTFVAEVRDSLKYYLFFNKEHAPHAGHNVLAQFIYLTVIWIGSIFMMLTGLAMQGEIAPGGFQSKFFGWVISMFGMSSPVRTYHHLVAGLFVLFIIVHLYLVIRQDVLDRDGTISSIFSGYKYAAVEPEVVHDKQ
ncbi:MAG TPA: Ni/Fe-hydrogenase, b-type cytochrome subunit [Syntrophomonas sp.]|nr:Ni/Fe-hydrogenase, b-type cytochrome subunit [Syntrophomonas sp.]